MRIRKSFKMVISVALMLIPSSVALASGQERVSVCHLDGQGNYSLITVADPALDSHMAHGDAMVGTIGLDENCVAIQDTDADGIPNDVDNCVDVANPDQSDRYGSAKGDACEDDSNGDGTLDVDEMHICVSIDGVEVIQNGTADCYSEATTGEGANISIAHGDWSFTFVFEGANNIATATGYNAYADSGEGDNNTATATGDGTVAVACCGNNNTATAIGVDAEAWAAGNGHDNNTATAYGDGAIAKAFNGNNNTATATGDGATAWATTGNYNTATAAGVLAYAYAGRGENNTSSANNTATATGDGAFARAYLGNDNIAIADGVNASAEATAPGGCTAEAIGDNVTAVCP